MLWSFEVSRNQKLFLDKNHISNKNYIRKMDNDWDNCHLKKKKIAILLIIKCFLLFPFQVVPNSVAMRKEAFTHCMLNIVNIIDLSICVVSTNRYVF